MPNEKTSVTKSSVSESEELESSQQRLGNGDLNDSEENDSRGISWKNVAKENEQKLQSVMKKLDEQRSEYQDRISELEEKVNLTLAERQEKKDLEEGIDDIESKKMAIKSSKEAKPWLNLIEDTSKRESAKVLEQMYSVLVDDFIESKAETENMDPAKLREELNAFAGMHLDKSPSKRVKIAFKEWSERKKLFKEKAEFERERNNSNSFRDDSNHTAKSKSVNDLIKSNDFDEVMSRI